MTANRGGGGRSDETVSHYPHGTEREDREQSTDRPFDDRTTIQERLLDAVRELVGTSSREDAERAVCDRVVESGLYRRAWVGERDPGSDRIVPRASASDVPGGPYATVTGDETAGQRAARLAMRSGEVRTVDRDPPNGPTPGGRAERRSESVAAVPLRNEGSVHGGLVVATGRPDAFGERERAGLDTLGRTAGLVVHAARTRSLLFADAIVELGFHIGGDARLVRIAADLGCELSLEECIDDGDRWLQYVSVTGAPPAAVVEEAADDSRVDRARIVGDVDDGGRVELVVTGPSLPGTVAAAGATVRRLVADAEGGRLTVEAPVDADVRALVERVRDAYPEADLLTRREHDRDARTVGSPDGLLDGLTDRQRDAIVTAYHAGYFDWPRESTAEEIAESLDLASATLHGHLRKAQRIVLSGLLEET